ncbi:MAG TPA: SgcJ/EcaC family oxidoreductase [Casimicrobiaceae bacterium]|jgi:uncharacterized protein (TIGR02246 family)|nr:SgcJ/EcaC family oxidoreductase [Casimicrobiaceae bacterium]
MPARTPEDLDRLFAQALNAGDLDALVALYEPHASLTPTPGRTVTGTAAIREALAGFVGMRPTMKIEARVVSHADDLALVTASWSLAMHGPDGQPQAMTGRSVEIARRQRDGDWLFAIDEPFGVGA